MDINREASDKTKGFILQKLRGIQLSLQSLLDNPKANIRIAIENKGDVFIYGGAWKMLEENKNYSSTDFSFASHQVLNTLVYFLDYWLSADVNQSKDIVFSFYSTNAIAKESNTKATAAIAITLPVGKILEKLQNKVFDEPHLIDACKKFIISEYKSQYKDNKNNIEKIEAFSDEDWKSFFGLIKWHFDSPENAAVRKEINLLITKFAASINVNITGKEDLVEAYFAKRLEDNQYETDVLHRFITQEGVENMFRKIGSNEIPADIYRYVFYDYSALEKKSAEFIQGFMAAKYFAMTEKSNLPAFLRRKVNYHSSEVRIDRKQLEGNPNQGNLKRLMITGEMSAMINVQKPNFLFGEIGSGKSTQVAQYALDQNTIERLVILIPVGFLKGKITLDFVGFNGAIDQFINGNIPAGDSNFNFDFLIKNQHPFVLIIDGIDELSKQEAQFVLKHLQSLNERHADITVIGTGRPLELEALINFNDWNCLSTTELSNEELSLILYNEAIAGGLQLVEAKSDAAKRLTILTGSVELSGLMRTPLTVCLVRDYLDDNFRQQTLGSLMYALLGKRLMWDSVDMKGAYQQFFDAYPNVFQREKIIAAIASGILTDSNRQITEAALHEIVNAKIEDGVASRNQVVNEAILFYKNVFLQKNGSVYVFTSQPLWEISLALDLAEKVCSPDFTISDTHGWRSLSFAASINRDKGIAVRSAIFFGKYISDLLLNVNGTPQAAAVIAESQNPDLAKLFITNVSKLEFRPLRTWNDYGGAGRKDNYSPFTFATVFFLAGKEGFDWFFEEYVNPAHPTHTGEEDIIQSVLTNYFALKNFSINQDETEKLAGLIAYHIRIKTSMCYYLLPALALVLPDRFTIDQRCRLLVNNLLDEKISHLSFERLEAEVTAGNKAEVLNALSISSQHDYWNIASVQALWFSISDNQFNTTIIHNAIRNAANGDNDIYQLLLTKFTEKHLENYLRFCALSDNAISDYSAILLFEKFSCHEFFLIARPILNKTEWTNYNEQRKGILDKTVLTNEETALRFMSGNMPLTTHSDSVKELYLLYLLKLLKSSEESHPGIFYNVIAHMPEYSILSRYPEIRYSFKELIAERPQYRQYLLESAEGLDFRLRFNANVVLQACFPEECKLQLENTIRSVNTRNRDHHEWIRFSMKLNYSQATLSYIYALIPGLPQSNRCFALCILFHQGYTLTPTDKDDLILGLLSVGHEFDTNSMLLTSDGLDQILAKEEFFPIIHKYLTSENQGIRRRAASALFYFHKGKISKSELAKIYIIQCEDWTRHIYEFDINEKALLADTDFLKALTDADTTFSEKNGRHTVLMSYHLAVTGDAALWIKFFEAVFFRKGHSIHFDVDFLYRWLKSLIKLRPEIKEECGKALKELMTYPVVKENGHYDGLMAHLAIATDEFSGLTPEELTQIALAYHAHDETICSLLYRAGSIPEGFMGDRLGNAHIMLFVDNRTYILPVYTREEIEKALLDSDVIPQLLGSYIESAIAYGLFADEELEPLVARSKVAAFFVSILKFCRHNTVDLDILKSAIEKIEFGFYRKAISGSLVNALYIIRQLHLNDHKLKAKYAEGLVAKIKSLDEESFIHFNVLFTDLFSLECPIESSVFLKILELMAADAYHLSLDLMARVFDHVSGLVAVEDFPAISAACETHILGLLNQHFKHNRNDERNLVLWMFALLSFYTSGKTTTHTVQAFLKGIESIFTVKAVHQFTMQDKAIKEFPSRDLLIYSDPLFSKIDPAIIKECIENGLKVGTPEIKSICRMLTVLGKV